MSPDPPGSPWANRLVLLFGIFAGIGYAVTTIQYSPEQFGIASRVYYSAASAAMNAENFYLLHPPSDPGYRFLYPPIVILVFFPHASLGTPTLAFALQLVLNCSAILGLSIILIKGIERRGIPLQTLDKALLIGFVGISPYGITQVIQGQVTLWLAFALSLSLWYLETNKNSMAGFFVALPAVVKLFPISVGLYLLRSHNWKAILVALITGGSAVLLGILVFGIDLTAFYFLDILPSRFVDQTVTGNPNPRHTNIGMSRQLAALIPGRTFLQYGIALLVASGTLTLLYRSFATDIHRQSALLGTLVLTLLILPLDPLYFSLFLYPLGLLLYTRLPRESRYLLLGGIILTTTLIGYTTVEIALTTLPLPAIINSFAETATALVFSVILPPTIGLYLLLASCVAIHLSSNQIEQTDR